MALKDSVKEATKKAIENARIDIDIEYCKLHGIKFNNHEINSDSIELFDSKMNKAAFDFLTKNR